MTASVTHVLRAPLVWTDHSTTPVNVRQTQVTITVKVRSDHLYCLKCNIVIHAKMSQRLTHAAV